MRVPWLARTRSDLCCPPRSSRTVSRSHRLHVRSYADPTSRLLSASLQLCTSGSSRSSLTVTPSHARSCLTVVGTGSRCHKPGQQVCSIRLLLPELHNDRIREERDEKEETTSRGLCGPGGTSCLLPVVHDYVPHLDFFGVLSEDFEACFLRRILLIEWDTFFLTSNLESKLDKSVFDTHRICRSFSKLSLDIQGDLRHCQCQ